MACSTTLLGVALDDCGNYGGVKKVYIAPIADVTTITVGVDGEISTITMEAAKTFQEYSFRRGNATYVSTGTSNYANGTSSFSTDVTIALNKMDKAKRTEMQALVKGLVYVIVLDENGVYHFVGYDSFATSNVNGQTGANMEDPNKYDLTLTAITKELPNTVLGTVISTII